MLSSQGFRMAGAGGLLCCLSLLSGCAGLSPHGTPAAAATVSTRLHGTVHGGQQPISGAYVQLWTVGWVGDGSGASFQGPAVQTDANGQFDLTGEYTCPGGYAAAYVQVTQGNPGLAAGTNNPAIAEMALFGSCNDLSSATVLQINEMTTIAAIYALGPWAVNYNHIGFNYLTDWTAFDNAFASANEYVDVSTGLSPGPALPPGYTLPTAKLNALADVISSCINSTGGTAGDGSPCGELFQNATPAGGAAPANTIDALINIANNPTLNVAGLFAIAPAAAPFQPSLSAPPVDWRLGILPIQPAAATYPICTMWGDSLTAGNQDSSNVTIPSFLALLDACAQTSNQGVGGQTSTQIGVREGGVQGYGTIAGGVIPAAGPVGISFPAGYEPVTVQGPAFTDITISGVAGQVTLTGSSYWFTRDAAGSAVASAANTPFTPNIGSLNTGFVIIWAGRNNTTDPDQVLSDIAAMVASLPSPKHYVILSVINNNQETPTTYPYGMIQTINQALATTYPNHFLDARSLLVADYVASNPQDVIDHANDAPGSSLRAVDSLGTLLSGVTDTVSCGFSVSTANVGYTLLLDHSEKVFVTATGTDGSGNTVVTGCTRGYADTTASTHAAGSSFSGIDPLHLNGPVAGVFLAGQINNWIQTNDPAQ